MTNAKEGQIYICNRDDLPVWTLGKWTLGKEYKVQAFGNGALYLTDDDEYNWYLTNDNLLALVFKRKEKQSKITMEELKQDFHEQTYSLLDVKKAIVKAYQTYDNDSQRLAFLKGYFSK